MAFYGYSVLVVPTMKDQVHQEVYVWTRSGAMRTQVSMSLLQAGEMIHLTSSDEQRPFPPAVHTSITNDSSIYYTITPCLHIASTSGFLIDLRHKQHHKKSERSWSLRGTCQPREHPTTTTLRQARETSTSAIITVRCRSVMQPCP